MLNELSVTFCQANDGWKTIISPSDQCSCFCRNFVGEFCFLL